MIGFSSQTSLIKAHLLRIESN